MNDTDILILTFWILAWTAIACGAGFCGLIIWIGRRMIASVTENSDEEYHPDHRHA